MSAISEVLQADPAVDDVLARHHALMRSQSPAESCHVMTGDELRAAGARLFALREAGRVLAIGALKPFGDAMELKSMHTIAEARGAGVARRLLVHLVAQAQGAHAKALYLETGSGAAHMAARALYERAGFVLCPPFGDYTEDPESVFMTRRI
ncbi:GNAT family N-acetyltransferase [Gymnodinialimonas ulvae]|uniref:GNAT family N-acetyltransferase n=1 Tax=Gymnodinialimonas ulvae TaxID=3126504 RepID=UPI0030AD6ACF